MKFTLLILALIFASCNKEDDDCKTVDRIIGTPGLYTLHFTDGTATLEKSIPKLYNIGDTFCDLP